MKTLVFAFAAVLAVGVLGCGTTNGSTPGTEDGGGEDAAQGGQDGSGGGADATLGQPTPDGSTGGMDSANPSDDSPSTPLDSAQPTDAGHDVTVPTDASDAGTSDDASDAGTSDDASDAGTSDDASDAATGVDAADSAPSCITPSPTLHPSAPDSGPYCPFAVDGGGHGVVCGSGVDCCEPEGTGDFSVCAADCTAFLTDGGTSWQCQGAANCPTGDVCCANVTSVDLDAGCGYAIFHQLSATVCAAACTGAQVQVCETAGECTSGVCNVGEARGADIGVCQ